MSWAARTLAAITLKQFIFIKNNKKILCVQITTSFRQFVKLLLFIWALINSSIIKLNGEGKQSNILLSHFCFPGKNNNQKKKDNVIS